MLSFSLYDLLPLACALIWACNGLVIRNQMDKIAPPTVNAIRCGIAGLFFWILVPFDAPLAGLAQVTWAQWALFATSLSIGLGLGDTLYLSAIKEIGVSRTLALAGIFPLAAVFFEYALFDQVADYRLLLGAILVSVGVVFISLSKSSQAKIVASAIDEMEPTIVAAKDRMVNGRLGLGIAMALGAAVLWGLSTVLLKQAISHMTPIQANALRLPIVTGMLYLFWVRGLPRGGLGDLSRTSWMIVLGSGLIGMGVGSLMFLSALQYSSAARVVTLTATSPLFGMILAAVFLKEEINRRMVLGMVCCVVGVWCVV
jgi:transporter family protein